MTGIVAMGTDLERSESFVEAGMRRTWCRIARKGRGEGGGEDEPWHAGLSNEVDSGAVGEKGASEGGTTCVCARGCEADRMHTVQFRPVSLERPGGHPAAGAQGSGTQGRGRLQRACGAQQPPRGG